MSRWIVGIVVAVMTAANVMAQTLVLPAAANAEGANQTNWRTDLQIKAPETQAATFTIELLESGKDNSSPIAVEGTVGAGESLRFGNLLETEFGYTGTSALRITATEGRILATSRTYNDDPGGTYGQTVPAVAVNDGFGFGSEATLILLSRSPDPSAGFRTNIGIVNLVGTSTRIEIDLFAADGTDLGTVTRTLKPYDHRQVNDAFHAAGADDVPDGYAVVRTTTEGGSFITYASVVDNGSGDAVFLLGEAESTAPQSLDRLVVFESFLRPG
jgi:hypothetical protein